jgi:hypothetical protein
MMKVMESIPRASQSQHLRIKRIMIEAGNSNWSGQLICRGLRGSCPLTALHIVWYRTCSEVDGHDRLFALKWDTFCKHKGCRKAKWDMLWKGVKKGDTYIIQK